eukprot:COSAG02_NODE_192_length_29942_cov_34.627228_2_plen_91_part_00
MHMAESNDARRLRDTNHASTLTCYHSETSDIARHRLADDRKRLGAPQLRVKTHETMNRIQLAIKRSSIGYYPCSRTLHSTYAYSGVPRGV